MQYSVDTYDAYNDVLTMLKQGEMTILNIQNNILEVEVEKEQHQLEIAEKYLDKLATFKKSSMDDVIFGKDKTDKIVNISIKSGKVHIFREDDGNVIKSETPYKKWVLSNKKMPGFDFLKGSQHYNCYRYFTEDEFQSYRKDMFYKADHYTAWNDAENHMIASGMTYFKNMRADEVSMLSFDIETTGLNPYASDAEVLLITNTFRQNKNLTKKTFCISDYNNDEEMIVDWVTWVGKINPSILLGHNIIMFDIPYLNVRGNGLALGRDWSLLDISERTKELRKDGSQSYTYHPVNCFGREIVDTFFLAIKADIARKYTTYGLKSIIKDEGLEKENRVHYDASKIKQNWGNLEERAKIIQYAEDDSEDPIKLFDLMIAPFFYLTPHIPKPFQIMIESATGAQLNLFMVRSYLQDGYSVAKATDAEHFDGAISFGRYGIYTNVFKVDVASLYPSIMRHYKIFPKAKDFNGNFLKSLEYFTLERLKNKKLAKETGDRHYKDLEQAQKVVINSSYGFMGASGLNYNDPEGAAAVTRHGREIITKSVVWATGHTLKHVVKKIKNKGKPNEEIQMEWILGDKVAEGKGFQISNCDTDSISFSDSGKEINEGRRKELLADLNSQYSSMISFEDDGYFNKVLILAAKNYVLWDGKKMKLKGSSLKDQKKEPALREFLETMLKTIIDDKIDILPDIYMKYIKEAMSPKDITRWAQKKTITKSILNCATDPEARLNERKVYDAINGRQVQEGDKMFVYPAITGYEIERKEYKNGKIKEKIIPIEVLKNTLDYNNDQDVDKLISRVYKTLEIIDEVVDMSKMIDYSKPKNKSLLETI